MVYAIAQHNWGGEKKFCDFYLNFGPLTTLPIFGRFPAWNKHLATKLGQQNRTGIRYLFPFELGRETKKNH